MENPKDRMKVMLSRLRLQGFRITPQRLAILEILSISEGHPTVEKIYEQVKEHFPTTSLATIYKTINVLKSLNEVLELGFADLGARYDGAKPYPHPHAICTQCGRIVDSDHIINEDLSLRISQETGFKITRHQLDFFGICPDCQRKG
jgi:Fur family peroxide stress response transcriptional regulator